MKSNRRSDMASSRRRKSGKRGSAVPAIHRAMLKRLWRVVRASSSTERLPFQVTEQRGDARRLGEVGAGERGGQPRVELLQRSRRGAARAGGDLEEARG